MLNLLVQSQKINSSKKTKKDSLLTEFSARSANDSKNQHLWEIGAAQFIPNLNELLQFNGYNINNEIEEIDDYYDESSEILADLFNKYGSDKAGKHDYYKFYYYILVKLGINNELDILEIGLGTNDPNLVSTMGIKGKPGASIRSFRDFCKNSNCFGADIDKKILFEEDRIETFYVDQLDSFSFNNIKKSKNKSNGFDLIIDDGLHSIGANFNTLLFGLKNINDNGWIVIEDIYNISSYSTIIYLLKNHQSEEYKLNYNIIKNRRGRYIIAINKTV